MSKAPNRSQREDDLVTLLSPTKLQQYRKVLCVLRENLKKYTDSPCPVATGTGSVPASGRNVSRCTLPDRTLDRDWVRNCGPSPRQEETYSNVSTSHIPDCTGPRTLKTQRSVSSGSSHVHTVRSDTASGKYQQSQPSCTSKVCTLDAGDTVTHNGNMHLSPDLSEHDEPDFLLEPWMVEDYDFPTASLPADQHGGKETMLHPPALRDGGQHSIFKCVAKQQISNSTASTAVTTNATATAIARPPLHCTNAADVQQRSGGALGESVNPLPALNSKQVAGMGQDNRTSAKHSIATAQSRLDSYVTTCTTSLPAVSSSRTSATSHASDVMSDVSEATAHSKEKSRQKYGMTYSITDVATLSITQMDRLQQQLLCAPEVCFSLIFSDGSSQLREAAERKRKRDQEGHPYQKAVKLTLAYSAPECQPESGTVEQNSTAAERTVMKFVSMPLEKRPSDATHVFTWTRQLLERVLCTCNRKVSFNAQEIMVTLIQVFNFPVASVPLWHVLDVKIACWMLDSDRPPERFGDAMKQLRRSGGLTLQPKFSVGMSRKQALCEDLRLLGPAMLTAHDLLKERMIWDLFFNVETKLIPILAGKENNVLGRSSGMESQGILVDIEKLTKFSNFLQEEIKIVENLAYAAAGHQFSMNSVAQLRKVLYDELKLDEKCTKKLARTQAGHMKSTAEKVLQQLQEHHPLPALILEYRHLTKIKSTYIDGLLPHVEKGVVRSCWIHDGTATGRLTSVNPNIQNIPKTEVKLNRSGTATPAIHPRDVFVSSPGWTFLSADFQSIELRLLAHLSNDVVLLKLFNDPQGSDIFVLLTSEWLATPAADVTMHDREKTKRLVYAVVYGVGTERLSEVLATTTEQAKDYLDSFLRKFPSLHQYTQRVIQQSRSDGYCRSMFGRMRLIRDIHASVTGNRLHAERQSGNFVIQGSAADVCKIAMINLVQAIHQQPSLRARLLLQIHDELLLEVPDDELEALQATVLQVLQDTQMLCKGFPVHLKVALPVSVRCGKTWGGMRDLMTPATQLLQ